MANITHKEVDGEVQKLSLTKAVGVLGCLAAAGALGYTVGQGSIGGSTNLQQKYGLNIENGYGGLKGTRAPRKVNSATPKEKNGPEIHTLTKQVGEGEGIHHFGTKGPKVNTAHPIRQDFDVRDYKMVTTHGPRVTGAPRAARTGTRASRAFAENNPANEEYRHIREANHQARPTTQTRAPKANLTRVPKSVAEDARDARGAAGVTGNPTTAATAAPAATDATDATDATAATAAKLTPSTISSHSATEGIIDIDVAGLYDGYDIASHTPFKRTVLLGSEWEQEQDAWLINIEGTLTDFLPNTKYKITSTMTLGSAVQWNSMTVNGNKAIYNGCVAAEIATDCALDKECLGPTDAVFESDDNGEMVVVQKGNYYMAQCICDDSVCKPNKVDDTILPLTDIVDGGVVSLTQFRFEALQD